MKRKPYVRKQEELEAFGKHLRKLREQKGLKMQDFAHSCGIEYSQISRIERGVINTSISTAFIMAEVLEIPYKDLFDFTK